MAESGNTVECTHEYGAPVMGWCSCAKCGKKERAKNIKKEENKMTEETKNNIVETTDREGNDVIMHLPESQDGPELIVPEKKEKPEPVISMLSSGKTTTGAVCTINCIECGAERVIKVQDKFQVKKCIACQKKALNKQRYESAKARKAKKKAEDVGTNPLPKTEEKQATVK